MMIEICSKCVNLAICNLLSVGLAPLRSDDFGIFTYLFDIGILIKWFKYEILPRF